VCCHDTTQHNTRHDTTQDKTRHTTQHKTRQHNTSQCCTRQSLILSCVSWCSILSWCASLCGTPHATHCRTLQHTATHCNTLQHTATHCNTLQHTVVWYATWTTPQNKIQNTKHNSDLHSTHFFFLVVRNTMPRIMHRLVLLSCLEQDSFICVT